MKSRDYLGVICHKVAQMLIQKVEMLDIEEVEMLDDTNRGASGFGSTGK